MDHSQPIDQINLQSNTCTADLCRLTICQQQCTLEIYIQKNFDTKIISTQSVKVTKLATPKALLSSAVAICHSDSTDIFQPYYIPRKPLLKALLIVERALKKQQHRFI